MKIILFILSALILSGCAASGQNFSGLEPISDTEGKVYLYRPYNFFQGGTWPTVFINGEKRFTLKNQGYLVLSLPAGQYDLKIGKSHFFANWMFDDVEGKLIIESNKIYYLKLDIAFEDLQAYGTVMSMSGSVGLISIPEAHALKDLKELKSSM